MDDLDLNIENYGLRELLNLFKLNTTYNANDLKQAKLIALKTHPDKSGLDPDIYIFFSRAYKRIESIHNFRMKKEQNMYNTDYSVSLGDITTPGEKKLLSKVHGKSVKDFNNWFNEMFESHVKSNKDESSDGYAEWFKSNENVSDNENISLNDFGNFFNETKKRQKALTIYEGVKELNESQGGSNLNRDIPGSYSSGMFSKLQYEDLKVAHTETVVPVTQEDFEKVKKYKNVDELTRFRKNQNVKAYSEKQASHLLKTRKDKEAEMSLNTAYNLMQESDASARSNNSWWKELKQLENK
jgi:hypothetical protein